MLTPIPIGPRPMRFAIAFFALLVGLTACAEFPALNGTVAPTVADGAFPVLVPLSPLIAQAGASTTITANIEADITPRLANLRARATRLRGPVIPAAQRARMIRAMR